MGRVQKKEAVMMRQHLPYYAIAAAILIVGLVALGVPVSNLLFLGVFLVCPLMMMFMMRGMGAGKAADRNDDDDAPKESNHNHDTRTGH
jgi:hypothetical protein